MTDQELLTAMEELEGCALISDDRGNWSISCSGMQYIADGSEAIDITTTFWISKEDWFPNIREAIEAYVSEDVE